MNTKIETLIAGLKDCQDRIGKMCSEGRPPKMSIPARPEHDDDLIMVAALKEAIDYLRAQADQQAQPQARELTDEEIKDVSSTYYLPECIDRLHLRMVRAVIAADRSIRPAEGMVMVPVEPTEEMWGELARDIMFVLRRAAPKPSDIFYHLEHLGRDIPQWLREEQEMKNLDHTISKGTCCVLIYKAMIAASRKENNHGL